MSTARGLSSLDKKSLFGQRTRGILGFVLSPSCPSVPFCLPREARAGMEEEPEASHLHGGGGDK